MQKLEPCFVALGFAEMPEDVEAIKAQYRRMAKAMHPDAGGTAAAFAALTEHYNACLAALEEDGK